MAICLENNNCEGYNIIKLFIFLIIIFISSGCSTSNLERRSDFIGWEKKEYYKKDIGDIYNLVFPQEYFEMPDEISVQEYRILPYPEKMWYKKYEY